MERLKYLVAAILAIHGTLCSHGLGIHQHQMHHRSITSRNASNSDGKPQIQPFTITVAINTQGAESNLKGDAVYAYLMGSHPAHLDESQNTEQVKFLAQHVNDALETTYFPATTLSQDEVHSQLLGMTTTDYVSQKLLWEVKKSKEAKFHTPGSVLAGRIYVSQETLSFSNGQGDLTEPDPYNGDSIAFIEFTHVKRGDDTDDMSVNLSYVDWVGLPLGMNITYGDAANPSSVYRAGMDADGVQQICNDLEATQGFWKELCIKSKDTGTPVQVLSPNIQLSLHSDSDAGTYWEPYVDTVWKQYSSSTLLLDTGYLADGMTNTTVKCQVQSDDMLHCDQGIGNFVKPKSKDIWGCSTGPFNVLCINDDQASCVAATASRGRVIAILCAAFTRSTMHIEALNPSPAIGPDQYYQHEITHHYSRAVHNQLIDGIGYAFPYDDVTPGGDISKSAGLFSTNKPIQLDVIVNA